MMSTLPPDPSTSVEMALRLLLRAVEGLSRRVEAMERAAEASRQTHEAVLQELRAAHHASLWLHLFEWSGRNPWPAVFLILLAILGWTGQLYLLPSLAPSIAGGAHAGS